MIPYILAAVGGYLIGNSMKGKQYANGIMAGGGKVGKMLYKEGDIVYVFQSASDKSGKLRKDVDSKYVVGNEYAKNLQKWAKVEIVGIISDELGWERYRGKKIEGDYDLYDDKKAKDGEIISFMQSSSSRYNDKPIDWWWNNPKIRTTGSSLNF